MALNETLFDSADFLNELNNEEAKKYIGGVVFVSLLMVTGWIGNIHVLVVYIFRMKPSNHRTFILTLATLDFTTCAIGMPFIIFDLRHPWTFTMTSGCKVMRFINYFIASSSGLLLLVIATDRYRKICVPLGRQMSKNVARLLCVIVMGSAALISWPAPVLYGHSSINISGYNITGSRCWTEDRFKETKYMAYFNAMLFVVVFICLPTLVVLYSMIWRVIQKHSVSKQPKKGHGLKSDQPSTTGTSQDSTEMTSCSSAGNNQTTRANAVKHNIPPLTIADDLKVANKISELTDCTVNKEGKGEKKIDRTHRTTLIFLLITAVFIVSYVPHLALKIVTFMDKTFVDRMNFAGTVSYNTFIWCFFINNVANAFIYGFCDTRFRAETKNMYKSLLFRRQW